MLTVIYIMTEDHEFYLRNNSFPDSEKFDVNFRNKYEVYDETIKYNIEKKLALFS